MTDVTPIVPPLFFDYANQAWVQNGIYVDCNHPTQWESCCYGRVHKGERCSHGVLVARASLVKAEARSTCWTAVDKWQRETRQPGGGQGHGSSTGRR